MKKNIIFVILFFILASVVLTYPLVFKMNSVIAGTYTTDESFAALWNFWWLKYASAHHLNGNYYSVIAAPFGFNVGKVMLYPVWELLYKALSIMTNNVISFNIQVFFSFVLSGVAMYYLLFYLTADTIPSLFAGIIYAFCPYHFARAWQHLALTQIQWMPLYILTLLMLKDKATYKNMLISIAAIFLVISFEFHYAYFMYIVSILFLLFCFLYNKKIDSQNIKLLKAVSLVMFAGIIFMLPSSAFSGLKQGLFNKQIVRPSAWGPIRPFEDLFSQSSRPLSYFLPATTHPLLGEFTQYFIGSFLYGTSLTEHTLYLGWVPLFLASVTFIRWKRLRKEKKVFLYGRQDFYISFFIFLAIASWFFSQPPWWSIGTLKVYMPSFFMYKIIPIIRAYCRFGIVVMLAVSVLAGFGLKFIVDRFKNRIAKVGITMLFSSLVLFEFWNYPPFKVIDISTVPEVYYWLKEQPGDFVIAEYPLDTNGADVMYLFYQTKHEKKMINATVPQTLANRLANTIVKLSDPNTAGILKWMGVKYVLVHKAEYLNTDLIEYKEELERISRNPALKLIGNFFSQECPRKDIICTWKTGPIDVYEIIASPIKPKIQ